MMIMVAYSGDKDLLYSIVDNGEMIIAMTMAMISMMSMAMMIHLTGRGDIYLLDNVVDNGKGKDDSNEEGHCKHDCEDGASHI